jgi:hypothetical protein
MSQGDVSAFVILVRDKGAGDLGPSVLAINRLNMPDMLQAFQQLSANERDLFRQAAFDGIPAPGCGFSHTVSQAKQVNIERIRFAFRVVTDKRIPKEIPGDLYETGQLKDGYDFLKVSPPTVSVWVTCIGSICADARLQKRGDDSVIMGGDQTYGQAGWDVGIKYGTGHANDLPDLISKPCRGRFIRRLSLNAHGDSGEFAVNGVDERLIAVKPAMKASQLDSLRSDFGTLLDFLDHVMSQDGIVLLQGCLAGKGEGGTALLKRLSLELTPRKIVGFSTIGFQSVEKQKRDSESCREPGARDTPYFDHSSSERDEYNRYFKDGQWNDLGQLPWQAETSPHAKVSQNGNIIRGLDL